MQGRELLVQNPEDGGGVRYMEAASKRSASFRQSLRNLLHALRAEEMAEAEEEAEEEAAAAGQRPLEALDVGDGDEPVAMPSTLHAVDKRRGMHQALKRRRYGFWVTAINKMGNVKRGRPHFIPALGTPVIRRIDPRRGILYQSRG